MGEKCPKSILCSRIEVLLGREAAESVAQYVSDTFKVSSNHQLLPALSILQIHSRFADWSTRASFDCDTLNIDNRLKLMKATNR
jgi:hypothetical protein